MQRPYRLPYRGDLAFGAALLGIILATFSFDLLTPENFDTPKLFFTVLSAAGIVAIIARRAVRGGSIELPRLRTWYAALGLWVLWPIAGLAFSWDVWGSVFGGYPRYVSGIGFHLAWVLLLLGLVTLGRERLGTLLKVAAGSGAAVAAWAVVQSLGFGYYEGVLSGVIQRSPSFVGNPNFAAMFIASVLPLQLCYLLKSGSLRGRIAWATGAFASCAALAVLLSRGALLAAAVALAAAAVAALLAQERRRARALLCFGTIALTAILSFAAASVSRADLAGGTASLSDGNIKNRLYVWDMARESIAARPLFGVGLGSFELLYERAQGRHLADLRYFFDDAHNLYLQLAATGGLPLALAFMFLAFVPAWLGFRAARKDAAQAAAAAGVLAWATAAAFNPVPVACWVLLAVFIAPLIWNSERAVTLRLGKVAYLPAAAGLALALWATSLLVSEHLLYYAQQNVRAGRPDRAYRAARLAAALSPHSERYTYQKATAAALLPARRAEVPGLLARIAELRPKASRTYVEQGRAYTLLWLNTGDGAYLARAQAALESAVRIAPNAAQGYYLSGQNLILQRRYAEARPYLETAVSLSPSFTDAWVLLAHTYQFGGTKGQMRFALRRAYALEPFNELLKNALRALDAGTPPDQVRLNISVNVGGF